MPKDQFDLASIKQFIENRSAEWLNDYFTFLKLPSISADPAYREGIEQCSEWAIQFLKQLDFSVEKWETAHHPIIFATHLQAGPDKPTLLIYNHYDVQPIDPIEAWISPPFEPQLRDGEIYATGAQDNKGQCFYVLQALKMILQHTGSLPINIKLCIEGEEEIGSPGLFQLLQEKKEELRTDYLAVVDLGISAPSIPSITLGTRGIVTLDVNVSGAKTDLHSGSHGGIALNPIHGLTKLLASLHHPNGEVAIPNFYSDVKKLSEEEKATISLNFDEQQYEHETGVQPLGGETDFSPLERAWVRPTLEINGISGGYAGKGFKTIIPSSAHAKISCRLVPDQDPQKIGQQVASFLTSHISEGYNITVNIHPGMGKALRVSPDSHLVKCFAKSYEEIFNSKCQFIYEGGSIPIAAELSQVCGGETVLIGLGLSTDQIHAPNEHFGIDRIEKGIAIMIRSIYHLSTKDS